MKPLNIRTTNNWSEWYQTEYLLSDKWREKSDHIKKLDHYACRKCGATNDLVVHHITYWDKYGDCIIGNEPDDYLITLCKRCHEAEHRYMRRLRWPYGKSRISKLIRWNRYWRIEN